MVFYTDANEVSIACGLDHEETVCGDGFPHRLQAIADQVEEHLLDLHPICLNGRQIRIKLSLKCNAPRRIFIEKPIFGDRNDVAHQKVDVERRFYRARLLNECPQAIDDFAGASRLHGAFFHEIDQFLTRRVSTGTGKAYTGPRVVACRRQRLVDLVRQARDHFPNRAQSRDVRQVPRVFCSIPLVLAYAP